MTDLRQRSTSRWLRRLTQARPLRRRYAAFAKTLLAGRREDPAARLGWLRHRRVSRAVAGRAFDFRRRGFRLHILHGNHFLEIMETAFMSLCRMDCSLRLSHLRVTPDQLVSVTVP